MSETPAPFNPFDPQYTPSIDNGQIYQLQASLDESLAKIDALAVNLEARISLVEDEMRATIKQAEGIVREVNSSTSLLMADISQRVREQLPAMVSEAIDKELGADSADGAK